MSRRAYQCEACGVVVLRKPEHTEAQCSPRLRWVRDLDSKATRLARALDRASPPEPTPAPPERPVAPRTRSGGMTAEQRARRNERRRERYAART